MLILILILPPPLPDSKDIANRRISLSAIFLVAMRVFCYGTVSSFMRALARYMRRDALGVPSRGAAAWCRPAVNPRADTPARCEINYFAAPVVTQISLLVQHVTKLIISHNGRRLAVNQNCTTIVASKCMCVHV